MRHGQSLLLAAMVGLLAQNAAAVPVRFEFSGVLDDRVAPELVELGIVPGMTFEGSFSYDTDTVPFQVDDRFGLARYHGDTLELILGGMYRLAYAVPEFQVFNDSLPEEPNDVFTAGSLPMGPDDISTIPTITPLAFNVSLADSTTSVFDGNALPENLNLADFDYAYVGFIGRSQVTSELVGIIARITVLTRVEVVDVAEPGTASLLGLGLLGLGIARRKDYAPSG